MTDATQHALSRAVIIATTVCPRIVEVMSRAAHGPAGERLARLQDLRRLCGELDEAFALAEVLVLHGTPAEQVEKWNRLVPIGAPVIYRDAAGKKFATTTRSEACLLSGHTAVVWLEGKPGCVALDHVTPKEADAGGGPS